jgi:hypothetical protein
METVNKVLGQPHVGTVLFLLAAALISTTVKPMPKVLEKLAGSMVFKAVVLLIFAMLVLRPLDETKMVVAVVATVVVLLLLELLRSMDN